jgi:hypothetical protein
MKIFLTFFLTVFCVQLAFSQLKINEVLFKQNGLYFDFEGDSPAMVEVINISSSSIFASEYFLSDNSLELSKWQLPSINIPANSKLIIYLSGKGVYAAESHTNFKIGAGESLILSNSLGISDQISSDNQHLNCSYSRFPDGSGAFVYSVPSVNANNNNGLSTFPTQPSVNLIPGVYPLNTVINFNVNALPVKFTISGKEVESNSPTAPNSITLTNPNLRPNKFSEIPTNPGLTFPVGDYSASRADNRGWVEPFGNVPKAFILRTKTFSSNGLESEEKAYTYFTSLPAYDLPIISIITDSVGYFDDETGIYVYGDAPEGNYNVLGRRYERPAIVQFFDTLGVFEKEIVLGTRIHGNGSRHAPQKVLRLYNRFDYDTTKLELPNGNHLETAILRGGGHRPDCIGRDYLSCKFVADMKLDHANPFLYVVYLNGEFWGVQDLRERLDADIFADRYGLDNDHVGVADNTLLLSDGYVPNANEFKDITLFAENNDMTVQSNYDYIASKVDLNLMMDLFCSEIFLGNADFPKTNISFWKYQDDKIDTKWRHFLFDVDAAFGGSCDTVYTSFNALTYFLQETDSEWLKANRLLRNLLENQTFKVAFINRMGDLLNTEFKSEVLQPIFNEYKLEIEGIRTDHVNRWRYPSTSSTLANRMLETPTLTKWDNLYTGFTNYFNERQRTVRNNFNSKFSIADSVRITLNVNNLNRGLIKINDLYISKAVSGVNDLAPFPWTGQYFASIPFPVTAISKRGYKFESWINAPSLTYNAIVSTTSDLSVTANFVADPNFIEPMINEVLIKNNYNWPDEYGQFEDWIEIHNKNNYPITIEEYFLTDDLTNPTKYRLKSKNESVIPANGYQLFFASEERNRGANHTNFKLSAGEGLFLFAPDSTTIIDEIDFPDLDVDFSYGSSPNGSTNRVVFESPTPLNNNDLSEVLELEKIKKTFTVYPNPNDGTVVYTSISNDYNVYNMQGALILKALNTNSLPISGLQSGTYLVVNKEGSTQLLVVSK